MANSIPYLVAYRLRRWRYSLTRRLFGSQAARKHVTKQELHEYWKSPPDEGNKPVFYISQRGQVDHLREYVEKYVSKRESILEIGCNSGRNLNALLEAGFKNLTAIEINPDALRLLEKELPTLAQTATLHEGAVEDQIKRFSDDQFDVTLTVAVLLHIHDDSAWIFDEIVRITKKTLIVIEGEGKEHYRIIPRNYKEIFTQRGMVQVEEFVPETYSNYTGRVFKHART